MAASVETRRLLDPYQAPDALPLQVGSLALLPPLSRSSLHLRLLVPAGLYPATSVPEVTADLLVEHLMRLLSDLYLAL